MNDDGATKVPETTNEGDPCVTFDGEGKPHKGSHKFEWMSIKNEATGEVSYFTGKCCKNCGAVREA